MIPLKQKLANRAAQWNGKPLFYTVAVKDRDGDSTLKHAKKIVNEVFQKTFTVKLNKTNWRFHVSEIPCMPVATYGKPRRELTFVINHRNRGEYV